MAEQRKKKERKASGAGAAEFKEAQSKFGGDTIPFLSLKDDCDEVTVRFLTEFADAAEDEEDVHGGKNHDWYVVHEVNVDGKKRFLQSTEDERTDPLIQAGRRPKQVFLMLVEDQADQTVKVWNRPSSMMGKFVEAQEAAGGALCSGLFRIIRNGVAGYRGTTYDLIYLGDDEPVTLYEDIEHLRPQMLGSYVLQGTTAEMKKILNNEKSSSQPRNDYGGNNGNNGSSYRRPERSGYGDPQRGYSGGQQQGGGFDRQDPPPQRNSYDDVF